MSNPDGRKLKVQVLHSAKSLDLTRCEHAIGQPRKATATSKGFSFPFMPRFTWLWVNTNGTILGWVHHPF